MAALMVPRSSLCKAVLSTGVRDSVRTGYFTPGPGPWQFGRGRRPKGVEKFEDIPGPWALPFIGNVWKAIIGDYNYNLESLNDVFQRYLKRYGFLVKEHQFAGRTLVHVFDPADMNKIYNMDIAHNPERVSHRILGEYRMKRPEMYRSGGLACLNGNEWRNLRKDLGEDFLHSKSNEAFEMITNDLIDRINSKISLSNDVSMLPMLYDWTLECMGAVALGQRLGCFIDNPDERLAQFIECVNISQKAVFYTENLPRIFPTSHVQDLAKCQDYIHKFLWPLVYSVITKNYSEKELADKESPVAFHRSVAYSLMKKELDERDIMTLIIDMFQGGIHSTAHVMAFALYHLARNPEVQKGVRASLMEAFPNAEDKVSSKPLDQKIIDVIRETMRLNPPTLGTGRVLPEDMVLNRFRVPKGTMCILHHQIASKHHKYFSYVDKFIPTRFYEPYQSNDSNIANSPFARGKRACPGRDVALNELGIGLSKILRLFEVSYKYEDVGMKNFLINEPDRDIKVTFKPLK